MSNLNAVLHRRTIVCLMRVGFANSRPMCCRSVKAFLALHQCMYACCVQINRSNMLILTLTVERLGCTGVKQLQSACDANAGRLRMNHLVCLAGFRGAEH